MKITERLLKNLRTEVDNTSFFDENNVSRLGRARNILLAQAPLYRKATNWWHRLDAAFSMDAGAEYEANIARTEDKIFESCAPTEELMWCYRYNIITQPQRITSKMIHQMIDAISNGGTGLRAKLGLHNLYMYANIDTYNPAWQKFMTCTNRENMHANDLNKQREDRFHYRDNMTEALKELLVRFQDRSVVNNSNAGTTHLNLHKALAVVLNGYGSNAIDRRSIRMSGQQLHNITQNFFNAGTLDHSLPLNNIQMLRSFVQGVLSPQMTHTLVRMAFVASHQNAHAAASCLFHIANTSCCVGPEEQTHALIAEMNKDNLPDSQWGTNANTLLSGLLRLMRACDIDPKMVKDVTYFTVRHALGKDLSSKSKIGKALSPLAAIIAKRPDHTALILQEILAPMNGRTIGLHDKTNHILQFVLKKHDQYVPPAQTHHIAIFNIARAQVANFVDFKRSIGKVAGTKAKQEAFLKTFNEAAASQDQDKWNEVRKSATAINLNSADTIQAMVDQIESGSFGSYVNTLGVISNAIKRSVNKPDNPLSMFVNAAIPLLRQAAARGVHKLAGGETGDSSHKRANIATSHLERRFLKTLVLEA